MSRPRAYVDWNATAPLLDEARDAFLRVSLMPGNPSSVHDEGRAIRREIETARRAVADAVGGKAANVTFTSGATEAANMILTPDFRMGRAALRIGKLYLSAVEHKAVFDGGRFAAGDVIVIPVDGAGVVDLAALAALLAGHDASLGLPMVAVMAANNESGVLQPIADVAAVTHAHGGVLVVDAVQALGRAPLDIDALGADFLILSSHKIGGPKGAGALVARGETMMPAPLVRGGGQEKGHRSGTENAGAIAGFGAAASIICRDVDARAAKLSVMRDRIEAEFRAIAPHVVIIGEGAPRLSNTSFFSLEGLKPETGQIAFDLEGVALSAGSACSSGKVSDSHVLKAMGLDPRAGALRISVGPSTTESEIDIVIAAFRKIAGRLGRPAAA